MKKNKLILILILNIIFSQKILIPMDEEQTDHLKAYGIAFWSLENNDPLNWLLNFKGGSFLLEGKEKIQQECILRGVKYYTVNGSQLNEIYSTIENNNMEIVLLEKSPKIAVYSPPEKQPWDDAVTLALTYAEIKYDVIFDDEVLNGELSNYDWLHLHHEDFTGQYGRFYASYKNASWYKEQKKESEKLAKKLGFNKVSKQKLAVVKKIKEYIISGGFLFAMCSATDSYDIALAASETDICNQMFDNDPSDPLADEKLDFNKTLAFTNFTLVKNPNIYEFSSIDATRSRRIAPKVDFFTLFDFSAKWDPVPTMLCQNHEKVIKGFMGQTTSFKNEYIKKDVIIMGETKSTNESRYIHGKLGNGTWTFYGGHDPEDYQHRVGDPKTDLSLHPNSAGYRLILNNILFPAAKKKKLKT